MPLLIGPPIDTAIGIAPVLISCFCVGSSVQLYSRQGQYYSTDFGLLTSWARVAAGVSRIFAVPSILIGGRSRLLPSRIAISTSRAWLGGTDAADSPCWSKTVVQVPLM